MEVDDMLKMLIHDLDQTKIEKMKESMEKMKESSHSFKASCNTYAELMIPNEIRKTMIYGIIARELKKAYIAGGMFVIDKVLNAQSEEELASLITDVKDTIDDFSKVEILNIMTTRGEA